MANYGAPTAPTPEAVKVGFQVSYRELPGEARKSGNKKRFELPMTYFKDGEKYNPLVLLKRCSKPKLLVFGKTDEFTSLDEARRVCADIPEPKVIKELDCGHEYWHYPGMLAEVNKLVGEFIDKYP